MERINFLTLFLINVGFLWIALLIATLYQTNTRLLRKKGYGEEYITFLKKDCRKRSIGIAIYMPCAILLAALVVWFIFGELNTLKHLAYVGLIAFMFIIPFPWLDTKKTNERYKRLAEQTKSDIVIDLDFRTLRLVYRPLWELITACLYIIYFAVLFQTFQWGIIHFFFAWLLYNSARSGRFMIRPSLKDSYLWNFTFMVWNHILVILHIVWQIVLHRASSGWMEYVLGGVLVLLLLAKLVYYCSQFARFKSELSMQNVEKAAA